MIVHEDATGGVQFNCSPQHFTRIHRRVIDRALGQDLVGDQIVALVEVQHPELLAQFEPHRRREVVEDELPAVEGRPLHQEPRRGQPR